jgi:hypothetical protein
MAESDTDLVKQMLFSKESKSTSIRESPGVQRRNQWLQRAAQLPDADASRKRSPKDADDEVDDDDDNASNASGGTFVITDSDEEDTKHRLQNEDGSKLPECFTVSSNRGQSVRTTDNGNGEVLPSRAARGTNDGGNSGYRTADAAKRVGSADGTSDGSKTNTPVDVALTKKISNLLFDEPRTAETKTAIVADASAASGGAETRSVYRRRGSRTEISADRTIGDEKQRHVQRRVDQPEREAEAVGTEERVVSAFSKPVAKSASLDRGSADSTHDKTDETSERKYPLTNVDAFANRVVDTRRSDHSMLTESQKLKPTAAVATAKSTVDKEDTAKEQIHAVRPFILRYVSSLVLAFASKKRQSKARANRRDSLADRAERFRGYCDSEFNVVSMVLTLPASFQ